MIGIKLINVSISVDLTLEATSGPTVFWLVDALLLQCWRSMHMLMILIDKKLEISF